MENDDLRPAIGNARVTVRDPQASFFLFIFAYIKGKACIFMKKGST